MGALGPGWSEGSGWGLAASLACREDVRTKAVAPGAGEQPQSHPADCLGLQEGPLWVLGSIQGLCHLVPATTQRLALAHSRCSINAH